VHVAVLGENISEVYMLNRHFPYIYYVSGLALSIEPT
jgi:hypothetical protein